MAFPQIEEVEIVFLSLEGDDSEHGIFTLSPICFFSSLLLHVIGPRANHVVIGATPTLALAISFVALSSVFHMSKVFVRLDSWND